MSRTGRSKFRTPWSRMIYRSTRNLILISKMYNYMFILSNSRKNLEKVPILSPDLENVKK